MSPVTYSFGQDNQETFFTVTWLIRYTSVAWSGWELMVEEAMEEIGIGVEFEFVNPVEYWDRTTDLEVGSYKYGGYDVCSIGLGVNKPTGHPGEDLQLCFGKDSIPPQGYNVAYWSSNKEEYVNYRADESAQLIQKIITELNITKTRELMIEWQKIWYDVMPTVPVYSSTDLHMTAKGLYGYDPVSDSFPFNSLETIFTTNDYQGDPEVVILGSNLLYRDGFNCFFYDNVQPPSSDVLADAAIPPTDSLIGTNPSKETHLPSSMDRETWMKENFHNIYGTTGYLEVYPRLAKRLGNYSEAGLTYTINLRDINYWHDGERVDAWDVVFSFQSMLIPSVQSNRHRYPDLVKVFGIDNKENSRGNYSFVAQDENEDGFFETINFNLINKTPHFETDILRVPLLPEHILGDPINHGITTEGNFDINLWQIKPEDWKGHSTNTANPDDTGGYKGPIGCGSYIFESYNLTTGELNLRKFDDIRWNGSTWVDEPGVSHYLSKTNPSLWEKMPNQAKIISINPYQDKNYLEDFENGVYDILDPEFFELERHREELEHLNISIVRGTRPAYYGMYLNPKYEDNGTHHLNKRGVRHAISHCVPRDKIVTEIFLGRVRPVHTPMSYNSWTSIPEEEMIQFRKQITTADGSKIEENATTAYDEYNLELAKAWMKSEGYDYSLQRVYFYLPSNEFFGFLILLGISSLFVITIIHQIRRK